MLITEGYRELMQAMHRRVVKGKPAFGGAVIGAALGPVLKALEECGSGELLDYGAGKGHLGERLFHAGFSGEYVPYDPGIEYWAGEPDPADVVACLDVLEHVEPHLLDDVLDDLRRVTKQKIVVTVHCLPAKKTLADGRNAHLTVQPPEWWRQKLEQRFHVEKEKPLLNQNDKDEKIGALFVARPLP